MGIRGSELRTHFWMLWKHRQLQQNPNRAVETTDVAFACRRALQSYGRDPAYFLPAQAGLP
jgi:hypothetical protein